MLQKAEVARVLLGDGPVVDFRFATIAPLRGAQVEKLPDLSGDALVIGVSPRLLAHSRHEGGLAHRFGVFEFECMAMGALFICGGDEFHVVLIEPAVPECRALLAHAQSTKRLNVLAIADKSNSRLMRIAGAEGLDMLCAAARNSAPGNTDELAQAVAAALEFVASSDNLSSLELPEPLPRMLMTHFVLTPSREADIERHAERNRPLH